MVREGIKIPNEPTDGSDTKMMMIKAALLLLCVCSVRSTWIANLQANPPKCPANEEYQCGSACFETCQGQPTICTLQLVCGCVCQAGYVRLFNSRTSPCIRKELCFPQDTPKKICGINEEYNDCGSYCPLTCAGLQYPTDKDPIFCIALCKSGCTCKSGFYRAANGVCVPPTLCCTGPNEVYRPDEISCQRTCPPWNATCTKNSVEGCFCASPSFVRKDSSANSPCIPVNQC